MKMYLIAGLVVATVLTWTGLGIFETSLWTALAVMAACEAVVAAVLFASRWRNRRAAVVLAVLSVYQFGQSYFYERAQYTSSDPVIPIDNFGVLILSGIAISLIAAGPSPRDVTGAQLR